MSTGLTRDTTDKFYTSDETVKICIELIKRYMVIDKDDLIIEPSAGNGSFLSGIKSLSNNYKFYDLFPEHSEIVTQNYLELDVSDFKKFNNIHVVGNPPFGRQSSMSIKFIKKSCEFCNSISFILPKSFKKDSMKTKFDKYFDLIDEIDLPKDSFLVSGEKYDVPCVFQIWKKNTTARIENVKTYPSNFKFVKKSESPDITFRRVGVNAGNISKDIDKNTQSHYFIKFNKDMNIDDIIKKLEKVTFEHNNTVGPRSISKQELIVEFNKYIN